MRPATKIAMAVGTALALGLAGAAVNAHPEEGWGAGGWCPGAGYGNQMGRGYGMGPGMMYGYGGGSAGYGMGPGAMGGWGGMGPGMMGGGGYGMGPGMHGYGYGPRFGGGTPLNLTDEQRGKIDKIQQDLRSKQWDLMGKMQSEYAARANAADDAAAAKADDQITALQQQMLGNAASARKQMDALLTPEQRQQLRGGNF